MTDQKLLPGKTISDLAQHRIEDRHQDLITGRTISELAQKALPEPDPTSAPIEAADPTHPLETPPAAATTHPARRRARRDSHNPPALSSTLAAGMQQGGEHHVRFAGAREWPVDLAGNEVTAEAGEVMREWGEEAGKAGREPE
ncbi:hypothetical protein JCM5296_005282 [Sporobolomyces johnsonii]